MTRAGGPLTTGRIAADVDKIALWQAEIAVHNEAVEWLKRKLDTHRNGRNRLARLIKEELQRRAIGKPVEPCSARITAPAARRQRLRETSSEEGRCTRSGLYEWTDGKKYCGHHLPVRQARSA